MKVLLYNVFHYFVHETTFNGVELSIYGLILVLKICQVLDLGLELFSLYRLESGSFSPITNSVGLATWSSSISSMSLGLRVLKTTVEEGVY